MKCFKLNLMFTLWCLRRLFLPFTGATFTVHVRQKPEFSLVKKDDIPLTKPYLLNAYEKDTLRCIIVSTKVDDANSVYVLDTNIKQHLTPVLFKGEFVTARDVRMVPDGVFEFPAVTIPDGDLKKNHRGNIVVADVTDFTNPILYNITVDPSGSPTYEYYNPIWMGDGEFIVGRRFDDGEEEDEKDYDLLLFQSSAEGTTEPWRGTILQKLNVTHMVLFKNVWKSYDAIFAIGSSEALSMFWLEVNDGEHKDWTNADRLQHRILEEDFYIKDIQLVDANKDGNVDLLVAVDSDYGEGDEEDWAGSLRIYEIPRNEHFKNLSKYVAHDLIEMDSNQLQPNVVRTFLPMSSYGGKPWILVSGGVFGTAYFIVPFSEDANNWDYQGHQIVEKAGLVGGVEAIDIDGDGMTELFVSLTTKNLVQVFSFNYNASITPATPASSLSLSSSLSLPTRIQPGFGSSPPSDTADTDGESPTEPGSTTIVPASSSFVREVFGLFRLCKSFGLVYLFGVFYLAGN